MAVGVVNIDWGAGLAEFAGGGGPVGDGAFQKVAEVGNADVGGGHVTSVDVSGGCYDFAAGGFDGFGC